MSSDGKIMEERGEGSSHDTPQAITITIMDPSTLETTLDSALVASVEAQDPSQAGGSLLVVGSEGNGSISVARSAKNILQTVTETHMGAEELPVISNINSSEDTSEQSTIRLVAKNIDSANYKLEEVEECDGDIYGHYCLICNEELQEEKVSVFKTLTATSHRKLSLFLGILVGQKITSRKAHSDIICPKCFGLLNKLDLLEVEIKDTKDEIINKYQESVSLHGGRARRKKPAAAKKSDYVFPKIEPEDDDEQALAMEMDETFEPRVDDLLEEEHDRREDRDSQDEEWEPEFKRGRLKKDASDNDTSSGPPKRKRGRPRKDASKPKGMDKGGDQSKQQDTHGSDSNVQLTSEIVKDYQVTSQSNPLLLKKQPQHNNVACGKTDILKNETLANPTSFKVDFVNLLCFCGVKSSSDVEYVEHVLIHQQKSFKCPKCSCAYSSSGYLMRHQRLVHLRVQESEVNPKDPLKLEEVSKKGDSSCKYCFENVNGDMFDHVKIHLYGENECPVCAAGFDTSQSLETHIGKEHSHMTQSFFKFEEAQKERNERSEEKKSTLEICDICSKALATSSRLAQHRYLEHPEHYPWTCNNCELLFPSSNDRDNHRCHKKTGRRIAKKVDCKVKTSKNKRNLQINGENVINDRDSSDLHTCPVCTVTVTTRKALTDHMRSHRASGFKCEICGAKVKTKANLRVHVNTIHTHFEIHQCKECSQIFFSSGRLAYHIKRNHTNRNTYTNLCDLCGKAYPYPNELRLHLRSHRNERPYKCDECMKTFLKKGDLTYHKRSHTGERPHKCPHCESRFPRPNTLMNHIRQNHQNNTRVSTANAATSTSTSKTKTRTVTTSTSTGGNTTPSTSVLVISPNSAPLTTTVQQLQAPQTVTTVMNVDAEGSRPPGEGTMMPVVDGQLVEAVVDGQMPEMQPVQYVQVDGLSAGQTVQAVQAVPHMVEGMDYDETACGSYQIVHLQILQ